MGLFDLHLHLLPGIDDGAKTMEDALAMARVLLGLGFTHLAPSPHHRAGYLSHSVELCEAKMEEVRAALASAEVSVTLYSNAENSILEEDLPASINSGTARTLGGGGRYLLLEAPYQGPFPALSDFVFRLKLKGVTPVFAHPERCQEFERPGRAEEVVRGGALLQLDVGALIGRYGKAAQKMARVFLDAGLYAIAATDLHSPHQAEGWLTESLEALEKAVGSADFAQLLSKRPEAMVRGVHL